MMMFRARSLVNARRPLASVLAALPSSQRTLVLDGAVNTQGEDFVRNREVNGKVS
jgi:hypothetical protein